MLDLLTELGVTDPAGSLRAADGRASRDDQSTLPARPPLDPTITRLYGRRVRPGASRTALAAIGAVVVLAATGYPKADARDVHGPGPGAPHGRAHRVSITEAGRWKHTRLDQGVWPTRGDLADDQGLRPAGAARVERVGAGGDL